MHAEAKRCLAQQVACRLAPGLQIHTPARVSQDLSDPQCRGGGPGWWWSEEVLGNSEAKDQGKLRRTVTVLPTAGPPQFKLKSFILSSNSKHGLIHMIGYELF